MKFLIVLLCFTITLNLNFLVDAASHLIRAPSHDSAIIRSDRLGGNFAYSSVEGHAYATVSKTDQAVKKPIDESFEVIPSVPLIAVLTNTSAYAIESATLPKEHRALPLPPIAGYRIL